MAAIRIFLELLWATLSPLVALALVTVLVWLILRAALTPGRVRSSAAYYQVDPVACRPNQPNVIVGVDRAGEFHRLADGGRNAGGGAALLWCENGQRTPISSERVDELVRSGALRWYYVLGAYHASMTGRETFEEFLRSDPDAHAGQLMAPVRRGIAVQWIAIILLPVLILIAGFEYWAIANGHLFSR